MLRIYTTLTPLILFFAISFSAAQSGSISGTVNDDANNEPLIGATVAVVNSSSGASTDLDGKYKIDGVAFGTYMLKVSYVGYDSKEISGVEVKEGESTALNITLGVANSNTLTEVVVTAEARRENISSLLVSRKNSAVVSDAISQEMIRRSPDRNTSDVLKRVSGITIQDNKFVVVRGMNDRYNSAMLNGSLLPSSEPDRKTFAFDIFPAVVIDNITVVKSSSPDLPGDFSGGLIQINTKEIPDKNFISVKAGAAFNSISTFKSYKSYEGGKTDWLGFDDGTRNLPDGFASPEEFLKLGVGGKIEQAQTLLNTWAVKENNSTPLNTTLQLAGGFNIQGNRNTGFGGIFALTHSSVRKFIPVDRFDYYGQENAPSDTIYKYNDSTYQRNILESCLADFAFKVNANNKFFFNNIFSINSTDQTTIRNGYSFSQGLFIKSNAFYFASNQILNSQLGGEHLIDKIKLRIKWSGYYTKLKRDEPDYRRNLYASDLLENPFYAQLSSSPSTNIGAGLRYYGQIDDAAKGANLDLNFPFKLFNNTQTLKGGASLYSDARTRDVRVLTTYISSPGDFNFNYYYASQDTIYQPDHYNAVNGFALSEDNTPTNHYDGTIDNTSVYLMFDNRFTEKIRLVWGVRVEDYHYTLNTFDQNNRPFLLDSAYFDFLPSANLIVSVLKNANLRFTFSKTVARPSYRELANAPFYDFLQNVTYYGNINLVETHITNFETRWEHYFANAQYYSASVFYKNFKNPIEQNLFLPGSDSRSVNFVNVPKATNIGFELEARKNFDFAGKGWENLYLYANLAYINSKVFVGGTTSDTSANRPLEGQSPIVFNASLQYTEPKTKLGASLLFNYVGHRLYLVGSVVDEPVWQKIHPALDFKLSKSFLKEGLVEFVWSDILHSDDILYYDLSGNQFFESTESVDYTMGDRLVARQRFGFNLGVAVSYKW